MGNYTVIGKYTFFEQVEVEADSVEQAIELGRKKIGRKDNEYENVEFEVERDIF